VHNHYQSVTGIADVLHNNRKSRPEYSPVPHAKIIAVLGQPDKRDDQRGTKYLANTADKREYDSGPNVALVFRVNADCGCQKTSARTVFGVVHRIMEIVAVVYVTARSFDQV
jgi:hypothetical protein